MTATTWPAEINAAKQRTGKRIAVAVKAGAYQVQEVTYDHKGVSTIAPFGPFESATAAVVRLRALGAS